MTLDQIRAMPAWDRDALVAERVMGYTRDPEDSAWYGGDVYLFSRLPYYSQDVADDYRVLRHVREGWGNKQQVEFARALLTLWGRRHVDTPLGAIAYEALAYEPGDFALAALAVRCAGEGDGREAGEGKEMR